MVDPDPAEGPAGAAAGESGASVDPLAELDDPEVAARFDAWRRAGEQGPPPFAARLGTWGRSTVLGAVVTGFALGMREIFDPPQDEAIVVEVDANGEPHDLPIRLLLDPDDPRGRLCIVRRDPPPPVV